MSDYISREAAIAYIREQSEELQKAFEELGGESGIYADAYNDLAEDFHRIPAADVEPVRHVRREVSGMDEYYGEWLLCPNCGYTDNVSNAKYCGGCGAKIDLEDDNGT